MKLTNHCYLISGLSVEPPWSVNSGFIVGKHATLVVDTGSNYLSAQTIFGYATCAKPDNKLIVVNTEPHFDHIGGNGFFIDKRIDVFAHPDIKRKEEEFDQNKEDFNNTIPNEIRKEARESDVFFHKTELVNPNKVLPQNKKIELGDIEVNVISTPGHTPQNTSFYISTDKVLYCGDCVVTGFIPNLEAGGISDWETWLESIKLLERLNPEIIVTGHGHCIVGQEQMDKELTRMQEILKKAIKDGKAPTRCFP